MLPISSVNFCEADDNAEGSLQTFKVGEIAVHVRGVYRGRIAVDYRGQWVASSVNVISIELRIENLSRQRKIDVCGFAAGTVKPKLSDEFGNNYKPEPLGRGAKTLGQLTDDETLYPETYLEERLIFEEPVKSAKKLTLRLPAQNVGGANTIDVEIRVERIVERAPVVK